MVTVQLWLGVVFLVLAGLLALHNLRRFVTGRYYAETHREGAERALWEVYRWLWVIISAGSAILFFFIAFWLTKYILTH